MTSHALNVPKLVPQLIGCMRWPAIHSSDRRGRFSKVLSAPIRAAMEYDFSVREIFWSTSQRGVIRGMHLQVPPHEGAKVVWVTAGEIHDVVVDLRPGSPTYRQHTSFVMKQSSGLLFIPVGCAHGFEVMSEEAVVNYAQECDFDHKCDAGIRWDSFGCDWSTKNPIISDRDMVLPTLEEFVSPFK